MNDAWLAMIRSVEKRRDVDARYYKPVCLLAVIDGMDQGVLKPSDIDFEIVFGLFEAYVMPVAPERAAMGWRPFWHLSRDGAWSFSNDESVIRPEDFGRERKPNSKRELLAKCDLAAVLPITRRYWRDRAARSELRSSVIEMMLRDDPVCRQIASTLSSGPVQAKALAPSLSPADAAMNSRSGTGQGYQQSQAVRRAVELYAMRRAIDHFESQGWSVRDVSLTESCDLVCERERDNQVRYVEVKGTQGVGQQILLTSAEVAFARSHKEQMILVIVSKIRVSEAEDDAVCVDGGHLRTLHEWSPLSEDLSAISYNCAIPLP